MKMNPSFERTYCNDLKGNKYLCRFEHYQVESRFEGEPKEWKADIVESMPIIPKYKCLGKGIKTK
jgi:hypothetical protein